MTRRRLGRPSPGGDAGSKILLDSTQRADTCSIRNTASSTKPAPPLLPRRSRRLLGIPRPLSRKSTFAPKASFVHRFPDDALQVIAGYDLDVMLRFGFNILRPF